MALVMKGKRAVLLVVALLAIAVSPMEAKIFAVDSTGDAGDPVPGDDICGTIQVNRGDPSSGPCTLRAAIQTANANGTPDIIQFNIPAADSNCVNGVCTINLTQTLPQLTTDISITGPGADKLTVRRDTGGSYRVFTVFTPGTATLSGMTITNGSITFNDGGGVSNAGGTLNLTDCVISSNLAGPRGGGIFNNDGTVNVTRCELSGNRASNGGGGIYNNSTGTVNITNSIFLRNRASASGTDSASGGGIFNANGTANVTNCTFLVNSSEAPEGNASGGGIFNESGIVNVANSALVDNSCGPASGLNVAVNASGGGIFNQGGTTNVTNSTLSDNEARALGPRSARGGGIFINTGTVNVTNSTLIRNSSNGSSSSTSPMMLFGGGAFNANGLINVKSTIIALNSVVAIDGAEGSNPDVSGPFTSHGFNLIGKREGSAGFTQPTDQTGTLASPLDPKLDDSRDNGGPTSTIALLPGSRAIDKGTSHCLTCGSTGVLGTDQRGTGFPRTFDDPATPNATGGDGTDIGAFEAQISLVTRLANISTRLPVQTGDKVLIGGFIITGTQPKKVILRAIGPSLPFPNKLADPTLELFGPSGRIESNDNWMESTNKQAIVDSTIPPSNELESAIVATLPANNAGYTAIVRGVNGGTGIGVVEAYDLDPTVDSELANISTRGFVQTGDNVLIAGTIVAGQIPQRVMIRAIGPSLSIAEKMEDPTLELRNSNGVLLRANDNWVDSPDKQAIIDTTIPPTNDLESAIIHTLPSNNASYTAIVRGVNNTTGIALVEVYALN